MISKRKNENGDNVYVKGGKKNMHDNKLKETDEGRDLRGI